MNMFFMNDSHMTSSVRSHLTTEKGLKRKRKNTSNVRISKWLMFV